jgi:hypothetical protein
MNRDEKTCERELANTRKGLQLLETSYEEARQDTEGGEHIRDLKLQSLQSIINPLKEEIARYEAHHPARHEPTRL